MDEATGEARTTELWCAPDGVHCALIRKAPTASVEPLKGKAIAVY
jgi:hypothetical protein